MTDIFRQQHRELSQREKGDIESIKNKAQELWDDLEAIALEDGIDKRMISLAKTNLEQALMWAVKAITA